MKLRILGGVEALDGERRLDLGPPKQRAVLGVLALEAGRVVAATRLIDMLWGEDAVKAEASLRAYISNLRRVLEPDRQPRDEPTVLRTQPPGYRLDVNREDVDALHFEDLVADGRYDEALELWRGEPLPEIAGLPVQTEASVRLLAARAEALEGAAQRRLDAGDHAGAARLLESEIGANPLRERMFATLALAQYRSGRQADSLRTVQQARTNLIELTGLDLGPDLKRLENDLLEQSPDLDWRALTPNKPGPQPAISPVPTPTAPAPETPTVSPFVGREAELRRLRDAFRRAAGGAGTTAVVIGEPGIGKTRLAEELAAAARGVGAAVAWIRLPESGAVPPYWPVTQIGLQLRDQGVFARLPTADRDDLRSATTQFTLHERVVQTLLGADRPLLMVIDDLQWADADSLRLLAHAAGRLSEAPVMVVVTTRPLQDDSPGALLDALGEMARTRDALRIELTGLDEAAIGSYLHQRVRVAPDLVHAVHQRTAGNPLFVKELADLVANEGSGSSLLERVPQGVQFVVRRRVAHLAARTQQLMTTAAVIGRSFDADVLAAVVDAPVEEVLDELSPALDAGLLSLDPTGGFSFSHALVADALAAEVNAARQARTHAVVAHALVALGADDVEIAHHALEGAIAGTAQLAFDASSRAAEAAAKRLANEDAVVHWQNALKAIERVRGADPLPTMLRLAQAQFRADLIYDAKATCVAVLEREDPRASAEAVALLDYPTLWPTQGYGEVDLAALDALEGALPTLSDVPARVHALCAIAATLAYSHDRKRREEARRHALALARESGDRNLLASALIAQCKAAWRPSAFDERSEVAEELLRLVEEGLLDDLTIVSLACAAVVAYEDARLDDALRLVSSALDISRKTGNLAHRSQLGWWLSGLLMQRGRYDEGAALAEEASEIYRRTRRVDADIITFAARFARAVDVGDLDVEFEALPLLGTVAGAYGALFVEHAAWAMLEAGRPEVAAAFVAGGLPAETDDYTTMLTECLALQTRAQLGRLEECHALLARTDHVEDRWIAAGTGVLSLGLGALSLAIGYAAVGSLTEAERLFRKAIEAHERLATPALLARALAHAGGALDDPALLERAESIAADHGFIYILERLQQRSNAAPT